MRKCYSCKRFNSLSYSRFKSNPLSNDRAEQGMLFQVISTDFVGPIPYRTKTKKESKDLK